MRAAWRWCEDPLFRSVPTICAPPLDTQSVGTDRAGHRPPGRRPNCLGGDVRRRTEACWRQPPDCHQRTTRFDAGHHPRGQRVQELTLSRSCMTYSDGRCSGRSRSPNNPEHASHWVRQTGSPTRRLREGAGGTATPPDSGEPTNPCTGPVRYPPCRTARVRVDSSERSRTHRRDHARFSDTTPGYRRNRSALPPRRNAHAPTTEGCRATARAPSVTSCASRPPAAGNGPSTREVA